MYERNLILFDFSYKDNFLINVGVQSGNIQMIQKIKHFHIKFNELHLIVDNQIDVSLYLINFI